MLSDSAYSALVDMRFNIAWVDDFVGGCSFEAFEREWTTIYGTMRALDIISEGSHRRPADLKDRHPKIPCNEVRDASNIERYQRDRIAMSQLWKTAAESLPPLLTVIEAELVAADLEGSRLGKIEP